MTTVLFWTQTWSVKPRRASAWIVPSSCHGVVFAAGNGKCQEMLSLESSSCRRSSAVGHAGEIDEPIDVREDGVGRDPEDRDLSTS